MREILFKGKTCEGEWIKGGYFKYHNVIGQEQALILEETKGGFRYTQVDPETVCQYTGLTDMNGVEIWENDIVDIAIEDDFFKVEWDKDAARFIMQSDSVIVDFDNFYPHEVEVFGNIFDNPELLRGEVDE